MTPPLQFCIDVSGQPKKEVFIGLISIQTHEITKIVSVVKKKYPWFLHRKSKGSSLRINEIESLISLLNGLNVRMVCTHLKSKYWKELIQYCGPNKSGNYEKIFSALYFQTLKKHSKELNSYPVTVCVESFMDINKTINYLRKISSANNINYQISIGQARDNELIKFADVVAAAGRKKHATNTFSKKIYNYFDYYPAEIASLKYYLNKLKK